MAKKEIFRGFSRIFVDDDKGAETEITISDDPEEMETAHTVVEHTVVTITSGDEDESLLCPESETEPVLEPELESGETSHPEEPVVDSMLNAICERLDIMDKDIKETQRKDELIRDLHKEMETLKNDFYASLRRPVIKSIIAIHRRMDERLKYIDGKREEDGADSRLLLDEMVKNMEFDSTSVLDTLEDEYDLIYFEPTIGDAYNPKEQNAIKIEETDNPVLGGTVKDVIYGGFKETSSDRIWLKANIIVYRLKN